MINPRTIHTHLYSQTAYDALDALMGQISDGYWENSPRMEKYWNFAKICRSLNGEITFEIERDRYVWDKWSHRMTTNPYCNMTDDSIREFFANKLKKIAKVEMEDENAGNQWQRDNEMKIHYLSREVDLEVSDIYCIYEMLRGRKTEGRYPAAHLDKICGKPKDAAIAPWLLAI